MGKDSITVVKVGGGIVEEAASLDRLLRDFAAIEGFKLLVHGGGRSATRMAAAFGVETTMIDGRRVTDDDMLRVVTMVYGGMVNKNVVAGLQALGVDALGMTGADMDIIRSHRRPVTSSGVDYGWVGDVERVRGDALASLVRSGIVPVVAPLTHDGHGHLLNTNADTMAQAVATGLSPYFDVRLVYCFEKPGVLRDADDDASVIPLIDSALFERLKADGIVSGGMLPKLSNSFDALRGGVESVIITSAASLSDLSVGTRLIL
ncbi:acetylglutamate kinase [uncultured Muribaculum sp.]|uniref:acetylglutamate kinase n=1 Tax=uncultured Muribaculum sp. TaxID=1918613 RepID=UPI0025D644FB|nr:acetylglutamate kinase [uncultured Muribaculum sp.]